MNTDNTKGTETYRKCFLHTDRALHQVLHSHMAFLEAGGEQGASGSLSRTSTPHFCDLIKRELHLLQTPDP